jgi:hypothetical protein
MKRLPKPTPTLIAKHMRAYNAEPTGGLPDEAVAAVFRSFPRNDHAGHVLAKVAVLNSLYFTNILAVRDVALSIVEACVDPMLDDGSPEVLPVLAEHLIRGRVRNNFSFATKYAHWHRPDAYPIYDSFVKQQLLAYRRQDHFAAFRPAELRTPRFLPIYDEFRRFYGLEGCTLREIDKWLWRQGRGLPPGK